jgi:uncharacterized protein (DUF2461 family)
MQTSIGRLTTAAVAGLGVLLATPAFAASDADLQRRIEARLVKAGFEIGSHDVLQKVPRGVDPAHPRADLLRRKGLMVTFPALPADLLPSRRLLDWLLRHVRRSAPLVEWLAAANE